MGNALRTAWPLVLVVVSGMVGLVAVEQWRERLRAEGRAELHLARADSMQVEADARRQHATLQRRRADSLAVALDSARAETERRVARERARRPEIVERIVHAPDTAAIREAVAELEASHEAEVVG